MLFWSYTHQKRFMHHHCFRTSFQSVTELFRSCFDDFLCLRQSHNPKSRLGLLLPNAKIDQILVTDLGIKKLLSHGNFFLSSTTSQWSWGLILPDFEVLMGYKTCNMIPKLSAKRIDHLPLRTERPTLHQNETGKYQKC